MDKSASYSHDIPNDSEFSRVRSHWRTIMGSSEELRNKAIELTVISNEFQYGYQWEWCGVPIIRHPDDIVLQQEIMWSLNPTHVIETGVARGGSLTLSSSLMEIAGHQSKVLGIDIQILPHAIEALKPWTLDGRIELLESDSTSSIAINATKDFMMLTKDGINMINLSSNPPRMITDNLGEKRMMHPLGTVSYLKLEPTNHICFRNQFYDNRRICI